MKEYHRSHFLTLIFSLKKFFWVLLLPVVRTVLAFGFDYNNAFKGYGADIFILTVLFLHALSRWLFTCIKISEKELAVRKGLVLQKRVIVNDENISCVKLWRNPFSVIFSCFILRVYENPSKKPVISLYITKKTAEKIKEKYFSDEEKLCRYKTRPLLHALVFGNNKGGFLLISALFSFSAVITGRTLRKLAADNLSALSAYLQDIPSFLLFIGIALLVVRFISLLLEAASVSDMKIYEQNCYMIIKRGIFRKILYHINTKKENIGYIMLTESIFFRNFYSLYAGINGFGEGKYDTSIIFPIVRTRHSIDNDYDNIIRSPKKALSPYITKWVVISICSAMGFALCVVYTLPLPVLLIPLFIGLLSLFFVFVNMNKWKNSYIATKGENIAFCHLQGVKKSRYITKSKKCQMIRIRQGIFQKRRKIADICFYLRGFNNKKVRIRHISIEKCIEIAENL